MSLSDDPISPTEKNPEPRETPFLTLKQTEKSSFLSPKMSEERHETFPYSVSSMNKNEEEEEDEAWNSLHFLFKENPDYCTTTNTGNLQNPSREGSRKTSSSDVYEYQRNLPLVSGGSIISNTCLLQDSIGTRNPQLHHSIMQGNGFDDTNSFDTFGYQSDLVLASEEDNADMSSMMLPISGFVNTSTTNNTNNDQSYISTEASNNNGGFLETGCPKTQNSNPPSSPLSHQQQQPQWTITKILTHSDVLREYIVLKRYEVEKHIEELIPRAKSSSGVTLNVYDQDKESQHTLHLEFGRSVYLSGNWKKDFVKRRKLREGHTIGFFWDSSSSMLQFSVLSRQISTASAEEKQKQHQWTIRKIVTKSDVSTGMIVLRKCDVEEHITQFVTGAKSSYGVSIDVFDQDMESKHKLRLKFRGHYTLSSNWMKDFVEGRELREGEEIGFFWDSSASMLQFSVLSRETRKASAEEKKV